MLRPHPSPERWTHQLCWQDIPEGCCEALWTTALQEDTQHASLKNPLTYDHDITTAGLLAALPRAGSTILHCRVVAREELVVCGLRAAVQLVARYAGKCQFTCTVSEGEPCGAGTVLAEWSGEACAMLTLERPLLNLLQHLSGISTLTHQYIKALPAGSSTRVLDTRKTLPGYRMLQKYAVAMGGGWNHRMGLADRILFKDNHWALLREEGIALDTVIKNYRSTYPRAEIQVEVDDLEQLREALHAGAQAVLLDNFDNQPMEQAVELLSRAQHPVWVEASGNLSITRLEPLSRLGIHGLACGSLIHQARWVDIGLDAQPVNA